MGRIPTFYSGPFEEVTARLLPCEVALFVFSFSSHSLGDPGTREESEILQGIQDTSTEFARVRTFRGVLCLSFLSYDTI